MSREVRILERCTRRQSKGRQAGRMGWGGYLCSTWHLWNSTLLSDETESFICELQVFSGGQDWNGRGIIEVSAGLTSLNFAMCVGWFDWVWGYALPGPSRRCCHSQGVLQLNPSPRKSPGWHGQYPLPCPWLWSCCSHRHSAPLSSRTPLGFPPLPEMHQDRKLKYHTCHHISKFIRTYLPVNMSQP